MPIVKPTFSEAREFGAVKTVRCDKCNAVIDYLDSVWAKIWADQSYEGIEMDMYAGELICLKCKGKMDED